MNKDTQVQDKAIEFVEWIDENGYEGTSIPGQKEKYWRKCSYDQLHLYRR